MMAPLDSQQMPFRQARFSAYTEIALWLFPGSHSLEIRWITAPNFGISCIRSTSVRRLIIHLRRTLLLLRWMVQ